MWFQPNAAHKQLPVEAYLLGAPVHLVTTEFLRYSQGYFVSAHYELGSLFQAAKIQPQIPISTYQIKQNFATSWL